MSFWQTRSGKPVTGSEEDSFTGDFPSIPNGTTARAKIKKYEQGISFNDEPNYQITWEITDGEFKGRLLKQNLDVFSSDDKRADRAINMKRRIYEISGYAPTHDNSPSNEDLKPMIGKHAGIKIREMPSTKKDGTPSTTNFINEIHPLTQNWISETGVHMEISQPKIRVESAFSRHTMVDDDLEI